MQVRHEKVAIFDQYIASSRVVNAATVRRYKHSAAGPWQVSDTYRWTLCTALERGARYGHCRAMPRDKGVGYTGRYGVVLTRETMVIDRVLIYSPLDCHVILLETNRHRCKSTATYGLAQPLPWNTPVDKKLMRTLQSEPRHRCKLYSTCLSHRRIATFSASWLFWLLRLINTLTLLISFCGITFKPRGGKFSKLIEILIEKRQFFIPHSI